MMSIEPTLNPKKYEILADIFINYHDEERLTDYISYFDLGLPLAYAANEQIVILTADAEKLIEDAWRGLLDALEIQDTGFDDIDQMLNI